MAPAVIAAWAAVAGSAVAAYGSIRQGQYQQAANEYNAQIAERDALAAQQKAEYDAETSERKFKMLLGKQKALYAKAGVDISEGSPLLMMTFQAEEAERDRQAILYSGKTAAQSDMDRGNLFRFSGSNAATSGYISAGSTLLTSAAKAYGLKSGKTSLSLAD
jgi:hypothetical protein